MTAARAPELVGIALAGGMSRRMARDKGGLELHGRPQVDHCVDLLESVCSRVAVSLRESQADLPIYRRFSQVVDGGQVQGPAAGLLAAWQQFPAAALLVLAVDMPFVDRSLLARLVDARSPGRQATAFRHANGLIEPLCAIWEPAAAAAFADADDPAAPSLRRILAAADVEWLAIEDAGRLASVNTPDALARARLSLDHD